MDRHRGRERAGREQDSQRSRRHGHEHHASARDAGQSQGTGTGGLMSLLADTVNTNVGYQYLDSNWMSSVPGFRPPIVNGTFAQHASNLTIDVLSARMEEVQRQLEELHEEEFREAISVANLVPDARHMVSQDRDRVVRHKAVVSPLWQADPRPSESRHGRVDYSPRRRHSPRRNRTPPRHHSPRRRRVSPSPVRLLPRPEDYILHLPPRLPSPVYDYRSLTEDARSRHSRHSSRSTSIRRDSPPIKRYRTLPSSRKISPLRDASYQNDVLQGRRRSRSRDRSKPREEQRPRTRRPDARSARVEAKERQRERTREKLRRSPEWGRSGREETATKFNSSRRDRALSQLNHVPSCLRSKDKSSNGVPSSSNEKHKILNTELLRMIATLDESKRARRTELSLAVVRIKARYLRCSKSNSPVQKAKINEKTEETYTKMWETRK